MIVIKNVEDMKSAGGIAAATGFFDGVHQGHRFLIGELMEIAKQRGLPSAVITFSPHPRKVLQSDFQPKLLNSFEEKIDHLASLGIDYCIVLDFTLALSKLTAKEFIASVLAGQWKVKTLLVGYDHRFGHDRSDGYEQYFAYGLACGVEVVKAARCNVGELAVSSSEIRKQLSLGRMEEAAKLLTYPYQLKGHIVGGHKMGRKLGFPTANIAVDEPFKVVPAIGVYAVWVFFQGQRYGGMLYIGNRPTMNKGDDISLEVYVLDFCGDLYEQEISVSLLHYVRGDIRFNSYDELKEQIERDEVAVRLLLADNE
jgi:riboflavin kinase/FMN adenylyltransferase